MSDKETVHDPAEIAARLGDLPAWSYVDGAIERRIRTANWKATMMVVATIGHLCEVAWHHPELVVSYDIVVVKLSTHSAHGITDKDFDLAARIDAVIDWRPAREGGALTGAPTKHAVVAHE